MSQTPTEPADPRKSIMLSTKKNVGIAEHDDSFDLDLIMNINTALAFAHQLGVGPELGFEINGPEETWLEFLGSESPLLNPVKTYIWLRVRMMFDPPQTSYHIKAANDLLREHEARIIMQREGESWTDPLAPQP